MRLHGYTPPEPASVVAAVGRWATPTVDELAVASARVSERLQSDENVGPLAAAYQEVLERLGRRMAKALRAKAVVLAAADQPDQEQRFVPPDADEVIDRDALQADVDEVLTNAHELAGRVFIAELEDEGITYDVDTVFTDELLARIGQVSAFELEQEARDQYRFTLEVAAEHGFSVASTADALGNKISDIAPHTARAMARTDLNGMANGGSLHVAQIALGTQKEPVYKTWLATPDERTRETHVEANGQTVPLNEQFKVGESMMPYPGYPYAPAEEVINCRCTIIYTSDPAGATHVVTDPDAPTAETDPLAFIGPSDEQLEAGVADYDRWAQGEFWNPGDPDATGASPEQYARDLEARLLEMLNEQNASVAVRSPADVAVAIAEDGRFKSQFEVGRSGGTFSPVLRKTAERNLFSYPTDLADVERPIYGYMRGPTVEPGTGVLSANVEMYGNVVWKLKASVRARTTFTANDSLALNYVPSPINRPSYLSANPGQLMRGFNIGDDVLTTPPQDWNVAYIEAQVHGGLSLDEVAEIEVEYRSVPGEPAFTEYAELDAQRLRDALARSGHGNIIVRLIDLTLASSRRAGAGLEERLGLTHDSGGVNTVGDLVPVASGEDADTGHGLAQGLVPLVEHPDGRTLDPVAATLDEQHERVVATLSDNGHATNDTSGTAGSQPSRPLPFTEHASEEAPMSTTTETETTLQADGDGEIGLTPIGWDAVLAVEGEATEDGRLLERGSIAWRDLPLSLMGMLETSDYGHVGARVAGRIDSITRVASDLASSGQLTSEFGVNELAPLIADRSVRGVSVDLAVLNWEYRDRDTGETLTEDDLFAYWLEGKESQVLFTVLEGVIVGATVCPMPAIANAEISLAASAGLDPAARAMLADALGDRRGSLADVPLIRVFTPFDRQRSAPLVAAAPLVELEAASRHHFERTEFPGKTPLTVGEPGEDGWRPVFGHIATWDTCHVGIPGVCTTAPKSYTTPPYALFHQAQYLTLEGDTLDVGSLMLGTGHAGLSASRAEATKHYDRPDMVGARVRAYDGEYGIWVSGVARAELTDAGIRELRENPPSGDWRSYNGHLELVAVCAVAVPGFPVVADAQANITAAGGEVGLTALIASSGTITPSDAVKDAMIAAGCACEDLETDEGYIGDLADLALS